MHSDFCSIRRPVYRERKLNRIPIPVLDFSRADISRIQAQRNILGKSNTATNVSAVPSQSLKQFGQARWVITPPFLRLSGLKVIPLGSFLQFQGRIAANPSGRLRAASLLLHSTPSHSPSVWQKSHLPLIFIIKILTLPREDLCDYQSGR